MADIQSGGFLSGKKTYIMMGVGVIGAIAAYLTGEANLTTTIAVVWGAISGIFLRQGVTKSSNGA